jgi:hypothetical protein
MRPWVLCTAFACLLDAVGTNAQTPFTEEALSRGVAYQVVQTSAFGNGVMFADLNGDGWPDLVVAGGATGIGVYENDGTGHFIDRSASSTVPAFSAPAGLCGADFNADGLVDIYVSIWNQPNMLLRNNGDWTFTDVASEAGVDDPGDSTGCAWGDYDGDGYPDLYISNRTGSTGLSSVERDRLMRNRGDGTFEDVSAQFGIGNDDALTFQAVWFDMDADSDLDLYMSTDYSNCNTIGYRNRLWRNDGGELVEISEGSGADICIDSMGVAVGDFDGDGFPDLYCTNTPQGNSLLLGDSGGGFVEAAPEAGVEVNGACWGANFVDLTNDGNLELYVVDQVYPDRVYSASSGWPCEDAGPALGMNVTFPHQSFCVAFADIDGDGDLDYAHSSIRSGGQSPIRLFVNHEGSQRNWARFRVIGEGADTGAIGARLALTTPVGVQRRQIHAGASYQSQDELVAHFGLGDETQIDSVVVTWTGGAERAFVDVPANTLWTLPAPERLGDANGDGAVDASDEAALQSCLGGGTSVPVVPGCQWFDFDGDFVLDANDVAAFGDLLNPPGCPADVTGDSSVDLADLNMVLGSFGQASASGDTNGDGVVDLADLNAVLGAFGTSCG